MITNDRFKDRPAKLGFSGKGDTNIRNTIR